MTSIFLTSPSRPLRKAIRGSFLLLLVARSLSLSALLLSSLLSLGFMGVLSLMVSPKRANP